jgi:hypothetical protein
MSIKPSTRERIPPHDLNPAAVHLLQPQFNHPISPPADPRPPVPGHRLI